MEIFTCGGIPYEGMTNSEIVDKIERGYRMPKPKDHFVYNSTYDLMLKCWSYTPERRPSFDFMFTYFEDFHAFEDVQGFKEEGIYGSSSWTQPMHTFTMYPEN
jgi:tyrosine-protein kinase Src